MSNTHALDTIATATLEGVTGGTQHHALLRSHEPQTDTKGAIEGGQVFYRRSNFACNGGICGGERV